MAWRAVVVMVVAGLCVGGAAGVALGIEDVQMTRGDYVVTLEKICKPGAKATQAAMDGVRDDVHADRIPLAAHKFSRAAGIFGSTIKKIGRVPRPPADVTRLRKWFSYLNRQEDYLKEIAGQLRADHTIKAQRLTARFIHNGNLANNVTLAFGFDYCSFKFSRFG
jgi:hypothetical protein